MSIVAIVGHGKSTEGQGWGGRIDSADTVVRCWDCHWQSPADYGARYDYGLFEVHPGLMATFHQYRKRTPACGYVGSLLAATDQKILPHPTEIVDQTRWTKEAQSLGGVGATGRLQFQRGTIATCWAIERAKRGDEIIAVGFDNTFARRTLTVKAGYSPVYLAEPSTFSFRGYIEDAPKYGNHDFTIERPFLEMLAARHGVGLTFSQQAWPCPAVA